VVVVGGGISGLAAAHRLVELEPAVELTLCEAGPRLGGVLETAHEGSFLIERSADNFITNVPWAIDLCRRVGLGDQLVPTNDRSRHAMVVSRGQLHRVPQGFLLMAPSQVWPILTTPILSLRGKLRLLAEYFVPQRTEEGEESLAEFVSRRFGREAFERLVQPLIGGIYTADPEKLSVAATMPRFLDMERDSGSLIRAALRDARKKKASGDSGARYSLFTTPRDGLSSLIEAIARRLPQGSVRLNTAVDTVSRNDAGGWKVSLLPPADEPRVLDCDAVIIATPAFRAARMLSGVDALLAGDLEKIPYAGTAIATLGYRREQIAHPLDAFGLVVPAVEKRKVLAASFSSVKFSGRAAEDEVLIRVFIGGAVQAELMDLPDDELEAVAQQELAELLGIRGEPIFADVARWPRSMPQYHIGHVALVQRIEDRASSLAGLALAGNAYHGVGIPNCIHSGEEAAEHVLGWSS